MVDITVDDENYSNLETKVHGVSIVYNCSH